MAEPPNHRKFERTKELVKSYSKYNNQIILLKTALSSLKGILEDTENKQSITATQGFLVGQVEMMKVNLLLEQVETKL